MNRALSAWRPTGGVVNPTPTISALALRAAAYIRDNFEALTQQEKSSMAA